MARLLSSTKHGGEGFVTLGGELQGEQSTTRLEQWVEDHFVDDGVVTIHIDVSEVSRIDLEGVAALALLAAEAIKQRKVLVIDGASGQVRNKLEETGLLRYLQGAGGTTAE